MNILVYMILVLALIVKMTTDLICLLQQNRIYLVQYLCHGEFIIHKPLL